MPQQPVSKYGGVPAESASQSKYGGVPVEAATPEASPPSPWNMSRTPTTQVEEAARKRYYATYHQDPGPGFMHNKQGTEEFTGASLASIGAPALAAGVEGGVDAGISSLGHSIKKAGVDALTGAAAGYGVQKGAHALGAPEWLSDAAGLAASVYGWRKADLIQNFMKETLDRGELPSLSKFVKWTAERSGHVVPPVGMHPDDPANYQFLDPHAIQKAYAPLEPYPPAPDFIDPHIIQKSMGPVAPYPPAPDFLDPFAIQKSIPPLAPYPPAPDFIDPEAIQKSIAPYPPAPDFLDPRAAMTPTPQQTIPPVGGGVPTPAGGPAETMAPMNAAEAHRYAHAQATEAALPGSPAGVSKGAHDYLTGQAKVKYGVKSWHELSPAQMQSIGDELLETNRAKAAIPPVK